MKLNEYLRREFVDAVNHGMKLVLTEDPSFENKMNITDKFVTSITDAVF